MQGFNMGRYVPPELEGTVSGNALHRKHPLGARASKPGALTVRFEMPFAVWCGTCPQPTLIGQGVRFNAEKRRVGAYHSTPVLAFRLRHAACGGALEIRTDPANTTYVVTEGGRRRAEAKDQDGETGGSSSSEILTDAQREMLRSSAFAKLERTIEDRERLVAASARIDSLRDANDATWEDPYLLNRRLRREFRVGRYRREEEARDTEDLRDRMSLGIDLVPASEEDARRAALVDFGPAAAEEGREEGAERAAMARPLFQREKVPETPKVEGKPKKRLRSETVASQRRENLVSEIVGNTRATQDPFLVHDKTSATIKTPVRMPGLKRKRVDKDKSEEPEESTVARQETIENNTGSFTPLGQPKAGKVTTASTALVAYDSGSD
jgi:coiled-coil domain-containing protein 130